MDNAVCGGGNAQLSGGAADAVKAAIFMGDPHFRAGLPGGYEVGTCSAYGVSITFGAQDITRI
jgi:acetylxylan esterase